MGALVFHNQLKISLELFDLPKSKENGCASRQKLCKKRFGARKYSLIRLKQKWVHQSLKVMPKSSSELDGSFFGKKMAMSQRKILPMGKIFKIDIFVLKHVLDHSKSIPKKKFFFEKFSIFWSPIFRKNGYVPEKSVQWEKISKSIFSF